MNGNQDNDLDLDAATKELLAHEIYHKVSEKIESHLKFIFRVGRGVLFFSSFCGLISFGFIIKTITDAAQTTINEKVEQAEKDVEKVTGMVKEAEKLKDEIYASKNKIDSDKSKIEEYVNRTINNLSKVDEQLKSSTLLKDNLSNFIDQNRKNYDEILLATQNSENQLDISKNVVNSLKTKANNNRKELEEEIEKIRQLEGELTVLKKEYQQEIDNGLYKINQLIDKTSSCQIASGIQKDSVIFPFYKYNFDVGEIQNQSFIKKLTVIDYKTIPKQQHIFKNVELGKQISLIRINSNGENEEYNLRLLSLINHDNEKYDMALFELCGKLSYSN